MYHLLIDDFVVIDYVSYGCYYYCYSSCWHMHYYDGNCGDIVVRHEHDCSVACAAANSP